MTTGGITNLLNAETKSFGSIIKEDSIFRVPIFQRDYSWEEEHWEDLWSDIVTRKNENSKHYMGSIVLINRERKTYDVIDGQQRLTTLTLIILGVIRNLKELSDLDIEKEQNEERIHLLMNNYIGKRSLQSLNFSNKLMLNEENEPFYSTYLIQFREPNNVRSLSNTNKLLYKCFCHFTEKVKSEILGPSKNITNLIEFIEWISDNLLFVQIIATDDLSAYLIFETLNDRGLDLSVTDLLKNYLFSMVGDDDKKHVKNMWNDIIKSVQYKQFPKFLRHYWNAENRIVLEKDLYKTVKRSIQAPQKAFELLTRLYKTAPVYAALDNDLDPLWAGDKKAQKYISEISLFNVKQCFPLMLICFNKLEHDEWINVFRICSIITFRYSTICGFNPNILEEAYNKACLNVANGKHAKASQVFEDLKGVYVSDEDFKDFFSKKTINTKRYNKLIRYILYKIENHVNSTTLCYTTDQGTIEHILPENPDSVWENEFPKEIQDEFIYRLSNYTLLEESINRAIGRDGFTSKVVEYQKSSYKLTNMITNNKWEINSIKERQIYMAKQAVAIWRIN